MIFIDANIFMYAAGAPHAYKEDSLVLLEMIARGEIEAMIDAEILQEILHRYRSIRRWKEGRQVYLSTRRIMTTVVPVTSEILDEAWVLMDTYPRLMARDALHIAACQIQDVNEICSYDEDFDHIVGLTRISPRSLLKR